MAIIVIGLTLEMARISRPARLAIDDLWSISQQRRDHNHRLGKASHRWPVLMTNWPRHIVVK